MILVRLFLIIIITTLSACGSGDKGSNDKNGDNTIDTTAPIISLKGNNPLYILVGTDFNEQGASVNDDVDNDLLVNIKSNIDINTLGNYTTTYKTVDKAGNQTVKYRKIIVQNRQGNTTAPITSEDHKWLQGDFTDTDGDGMTDVAELKYNFNPNDANSFPQTQAVITEFNIAIPESEINAYAVPTPYGFNIKWKNLTSSTFSLRLYNAATRLYYGGHYSEYAQVNYAEFSLIGNEILKGSFKEYNKLTRKFISQKQEFTINLANIIQPTVGKSNNKISYSFENFSEEQQKPYKDFLQRVWPIMYEKLGAPAESFNTVIVNLGADRNTFTTIDNGRKFLTDGRFIPRLIVHEFVHAWKGTFSITNDQNWKYDNSLSGFEEGSAEGMAFEIMHEYVRSYPTDFATKKLFSYRSSQYHSRYTNHIDTIKYQKNTGSGSFWNFFEGANYKYSIASVTVQMIIKEYPNFYKKMMQKIYDTINNDKTWRPTRQKIIDIWKSIAPTVQGIALDKYLNAMPVFNGKKLDEGMHILSEIRHYGTSGDQQIVVTYALKDGDGYWGIKKSEIASYNIPSWIKYDDDGKEGNANYVYIDTQNQPFTVEIFKPHNNELLNNYSFLTKYARRSDGTATGFGWEKKPKLAMQNLPLGLYREKVTFDNYIAHDSGASEEFYTFGYDGIEKFKRNDFIIMIGIDAPINGGTMTINIQQNKLIKSITNNIAIFNMPNLALDAEGVFDISIFDGVNTCHYKRTLIESNTIHSYKQYGFVIKDQNSNCVEDWYENMAEKHMNKAQNNSIMSNKNTSNNNAKCDTLLRKQGAQPRRQDALGPEEPKDIIINENSKQRVHGSEYIKSCFNN